MLINSEAYVSFIYPDGTNSDGYYNQSLCIGREVSLSGKTFKIKAVEEVKDDEIECQCFDVWLEE